MSKVSASIEMIPDDEPASVTIGGGETEAFFQFRIPKGKGDKGNKGTDAAEITGINLTSNGGLHFVLSDGRELSTDSVIGPAGRNVQKVTLEGDGMLRFDMSDGTSLKAGPVFEGGTVVVDASTTAKGV
ncbi:hypothetical protein, partial [Propionibacterium freudenreichii]|uniref:hypothetical protein n=1 Tax=Propionibacterium freudenreichii TaxID=1744 RepID=UPI0012D9CACB